MLIKIERFSTGPFETDKLVFATVVNWPEDQLFAFLEAIGAEEIFPAESEPLYGVWQSELPPFRVSAHKEGFEV